MLRTLSDLPFKQTESADGTLSSEVLPCGAVQDRTPPKGCPCNHRATCTAANIFLDNK